MYTDNTHLYIRKFLLLQTFLPHYNPSNQYSAGLNSIQTLRSLGIPNGFHWILHRGLNQRNNRENSSSEQFQSCDLYLAPADSERNQWRRVAVSLHACHTQSVCPVASRRHVYTTIVMSVKKSSRIVEFIMLISFPVIGISCWTWHERTDNNFKCWWFSR